MSESWGVLFSIKAGFTKSCHFWPSWKGNCGPSHLPPECKRDCVRVSVQFLSPVQTHGIDGPGHMVSDPSFVCSSLLKKILYYNRNFSFHLCIWGKCQSSVRSRTKRTSVWLSPASCSVGGLGHSSEGRQGRTRRGKLASIWKFSGLSFKVNRKSWITCGGRGENYLPKDSSWNISRKQINADSHFTDLFCALPWAIINPFISMEKKHCFWKAWEA